MVGKETILRVADNSGLIYVKCVNPPLSLTKYTFKLGEIITVFPKIIDYSKKLRKKKYFCLVISLKKITRRKNGLWVSFLKNRVLVLNDQFKFLGTRVKGPICREIRTKKGKILYKKIISYSGGTI
jgi:large subunit ribosomal protein L14